MSKRIQVLTAEISTLNAEADELEAQLAAETDDWNIRALSMRLNRVCFNINLKSHALSLAV